MNRFIPKISLLVMTALLAASAYAGSERASADDCVALVKKAVAYVKANGKEKAFAEFNNPKGQFIDRNLYIFVYDLNGVNLAIGNGNASKMVGKNLLDMRDAEGTYIIKGFIQTVKTKNQGWFDYKWPNPVTKAIEEKSSYIEKVDDYMVGAGIYKQ